MDNKRKVTFFSVLASLMAASGAVFAANPTINHIFIVLPLVLMSFFLFFAGYYAGLAQKSK